MIIKQAELLTEIGVYRIVNIINGKSYIGSTKMSFLKRYHHHVSLLRINTHKNMYLQNSFNKYGEDKFYFEIIEVCSKEQCLDREQYYINSLSNLYNINKFATGIDSSQKDVIEKRRQTTIRRYANGELDHVKEKLRDHIPWNKGKKYISTDHLKVPKSKKISVEILKKVRRIRLPQIQVYSNNILLGTFKNAKELEEWSITNKNNFPIKGRFTVSRMNKPIDFLCSGNINKACRSNKSYKGLYFKFLTSPFTE